jgi:hypothetical protein
MVALDGARRRVDGGGEGVDRDGNRRSPAQNVLLFARPTLALSAATIPLCQ